MQWQAALWWVPIGLVLGAALGLFIDWLWRQHKMQGIIAELAKAFPNSVGRFLYGLTVSKFIKQLQAQLGWTYDEAAQAFTHMATKERDPAAVIDYAGNLDLQDVVEGLMGFMNPDAVPGQETAIGLLDGLGVSGLDGEDLAKIYDAWQAASAARVTAGWDTPAA